MKCHVRATSSYHSGISSLLLIHLHIYVAMWVDRWSLVNPVA